MRAEDLLTEERRARMAAEKLLAQKEAELQSANRMLSRHAVKITENLVETREEMAEVKGENTRVRADLDKATEEVVIAKRRLWNSIQTIDDGFAVFDSDSRLIIANAAYLLPFDGLECIRPGAHYEEVLEAAISEGVVDIEGMTPLDYREALLDRWRSPDPSPRVIRLWDGTHIRLVDSRAPGGDTVSLGLNITDSVRREKVLQEARVRAEAANRAKSAFLANMSHEIRTPMNGVVGMADLLAESALDDEQQLYVSTIRNSGHALLAIINDVLDYSKIEASKLTLHEVAFDLERTVLDVIQLLSPSIREKGLKVMLDYDMFLPTRFVGDPVRIRQVLTNLMGNAVKFTNTGHVLVRVIGLPVDDGKRQRVHVTVEDTGIGIPKDMLAHVFGEFNQVEDERNRAYEGTGLGLAITQKLIRLMGGEIWVESDLGVGSAFGFHVTLPIVEGEPEAPALPDWIGRALLVMADDLHRDILAKRLIALGLAVSSVDTAAAATDGRARDVDVILADQRLPDMSAAAFIAVLRKSRATAPVLMIASPIGGQDGVLVGAAAVLTRPTSRPDLLKALAELPRPHPALPIDEAVVVAPEAAPPVAQAPAAPALAAEPEAAPAPAPSIELPQPTRAAPAAEPEASAEPEPGAGQNPKPEIEPQPTPLVAPALPRAAGPEAAPEPVVFGSRRTAETSSPVFGSRRGGPPSAALPQPEPEPTSADVENFFAAPAHVAPPALPPAEPEAHALRRMRVLAAEDNKTNQLVFSKLVKACDIDLHFAGNGHEAVAAFEAQRPDLIFMDISMPGMDGKEATRRIRALEAKRGLPRTRIVALTAHAMDGDAEEILGHGLDAHLTKPFKKPAILAEIGEAKPDDARAPLPAADALPDALASVVAQAQSAGGDAA